MKKTGLVMAFAIFFTCAAFSQDSTQSATTKQHRVMTHKKPMRDRNTTTSVDSVNAGKITSNPSGKMNSRSSSAKMKTGRKAANSSSANSVDSTK